MKNHIIGLLIAAQHALKVDWMTFGLAMLALAALTGTVIATQINTGVKIQSIDGAGVYTVTQWNITFTNLTVNSANAVFRGLTAGTDGFAQTKGLFCNEATLCNVTSTSSNDNLYINDFIQNTSAISVDNISGTATDMNIWYTTTATGNLTVDLGDLDGDCNYGQHPISGYDSSIQFVHITRSDTDYTICNNMVLQANSTAGSYRINVEEKSVASESTLATLVAALAAGLSITTVAIGYKWDSTS